MELSVILFYGQSRNLERFHGVGRIVMNIPLNSHFEKDDWDYLDRLGTLALLFTVTVLAVLFGGYLLSLVLV